MEISNIKLVKPFGPLVMMAELPETVIKSCNEIVDVIKDRKDMGSRLAGQIKSESEIPHSMLEQKNVMNDLQFGPWGPRRVCAGFAQCSRRVRA